MYIHRYIQHIHTQTDPVGLYPQSLYCTSVSISLDPLRSYFNPETQNYQSRLTLSNHPTEVSLSKALHPDYHVI